MGGIYQLPAMYKNKTKLKFELNSATILRRCHLKPELLWYGLLVLGGVCFICSLLPYKVIATLFVTYAQ